MFRFGVRNLERSPRNAPRAPSRERRILGALDAKIITIPESRAVT